MQQTQNWVGFLDRSYQQIKKSVLKRLIINNPELTDHTESNPLIALISMFAGIGEMWNYYIDSLAREAFLSTARKFSSVIKHAHMIDYRAKACVPANVDLTFTLVDANGNPVIATEDVNIPTGTRVSNDGTIEFVIKSAVTIPTGFSQIVVSASNYKNVSDLAIGTTDGTPSQKVLLPTNYVNNSLSLSINGEAWTLYNSFARMDDTTKGFIVDIDETGNAYVVFGDGVNGDVPATGFSILATYQITDAEQGNLPPDSINKIITSIDLPLSLPSGTVLSVNNADYASNGSPFETMDSIRENAPKSLRTLDRAVTYQDYKDITNLVDGVGTSEIKYCCGKYVDVYITPSTRGTASQTLIDKVTDELNLKKMITTAIAVHPSGVSRVWLEATIYGKPLYTSDAILIDVVNKLDEVYGYTHTKINESLSLSDITFEIESLEKVDRIDIAKIRVEPFTRITTGQYPLDITFNTLPVGTVIVNYQISYDLGTNKFYIVKNDTPIGSVDPGGSFTDGTINITLKKTYSYASGDTWAFQTQTSYPETFPSSLIQIKDYSTPIIDVGPLIDPDLPRTIFSNLTIVTQGISSSALPSCNDNG